MQDLFAQISVCVALGCALSVAVAAALSRSRSKPAALAVLARLIVAGGPVYLGANYALYQGHAAATAAVAGFALGLFGLRGWWFPERVLEVRSRRAAATERQSAPALQAASAGIVYLAGSRRGASLAGAALRTRAFGVVRDDRQDARPGDRSMSSAA